MARTERCRHLPKRVRTPYGGINTAKIVDGNAHRRDYENRVRERVEKLFGGPRPDYSVFDPKYGTHHKYVKATKKSYVFDYKTGGYKWDYDMLWKEFPGSWRPNPERLRWEALERQVEQEMVRPASSWHPWQRGGKVGTSKKDGKQRGNRRFRHAVKQALPKYDAEEDLLPELDEKYDIWDVY